MLLRFQSHRLAYPQLLILPGGPLFRIVLVRAWLRGRSEWELRMAACRLLRDIRVFFPAPPPPPPRAVYGEGAAGRDDYVDDDDHPEMGARGNHSRLCPRRASPCPNIYSLLFPIGTPV